MTSTAIRLTVFISTQTSNNIILAIKQATIILSLEWMRAITWATRYLEAGTAASLFGAALPRCAVYRLSRGAVTAGDLPDIPLLSASNMGALSQIVLHAAAAHFVQMGAVWRLWPPRGGRIRGRRRGPHTRRPAQRQQLVLGAAHSGQRGAV